MVPLAFAEIEKFPCAVLAERFSDVPNLGDVTKIDWGEWLETNPRPDVLVGGSPCQSFSVAGTRTGLAGASGLMWEYVRAVHELRPRWFVWENVPGALSSTDGEDFRCLLRELGDGGRYGLAWRVLDARWFGVAQRRRRVFVVGSLGGLGPQRACEVLFEPSVLQGRAAAQEREQAAFAAALARRAGTASWAVRLSNTNSNGRGIAEESVHTVDCRGPEAVAYDFKYHASRTCGTNCWAEEVAPTEIAGKPGAVCCYTEAAGTGGGLWDNGDMASTLKAKAPITENIVVCMADQQGHSPVEVELCGTLTSHSMKSPPIVGGRAMSGEGMVARKLTPTEAERLQGFPDDFTKVPYRGKPADECPDGPRYKALGNSMCVNVMRWIGERIAAVECLYGKEET